MFSKSKTTSKGGSTGFVSMGSAATFSVIGADVVITGNISATVDLHIDGIVEGDIQCAALDQGEGSKINGCVTADTARLAGIVEGSIDARELVILSTARITGDVTYEQISIETGGNVQGQFNIRGNMALLSTDLKLVASD